MTDEDLARKFNNLTHPVIGAERANKLRTAMYAIDEKTDLTELIELTKAGTEKIFS
jgi:hypothetical protein